jgi:hypothetical protein
MKEKQLNKAYFQLRLLSVLLSLQFLLGITLSTLLDYDPKHRTVVQVVFLIIHITVACLLAIMAIYRLATALFWNYLIILSSFGLLSVIMALVSGAIAAANANKVAVFLMSLGFLGAFGAYGYSMSAISRQRTTK